MKALDIKNLKKIYSNKFEALKGIDLEVQEGDFFALLGPNGAGKSTIIGIVTSLINKSVGDVKVFEYDIDKDVVKAKECVGIVPQEFNFNIWEPVEEIIVNQAGFYGISKQDAKKKSDELLKELDLYEKRHEQANNLSGGMKRRLMIARALVHNPKLLILDEPTAGVDIEIRRHMWNYLRKLNKSGTTIILTTHYLEEAESLCKNIAIIDKGKIIENTTMKSLLTKLDVEIFVFDLKNKIEKIPKCRKYNIKLIDSTTLEAEISKKDSFTELFEMFKKEKIEILSMRNKTNRLEELFVRLVKNGSK